MDAIERLEQSQDDDKVIEVIEQLTCAADGGDKFVINEFGAQAIIAMLNDSVYAKRMLVLHEEHYET